MKSYRVTMNNGDVFMFDDKRNRSLIEILQLMFDKRLHVTVSIWDTHVGTVAFNSHSISTVEDISKNE